MAKIKFLSKSPYAYTFLICFIYYGYLLLTTHPVLQCDAQLYHQLGEFLHNEGWHAYFRKGPLQEPIYPFLVASAMKWGQHLPGGYLFLIKIIQLSWLFLTLFLLKTVLRRLKINDSLGAIISLYYGLSPALVNSALCVYSEVIIYPFILGSILAASYAWEQLRRDDHRRVLLGGALIGLFGILTTMVKGIFEVITPLFLFPFLIWLVGAIRKNDFRLSRKILILFCGFVLTYYGPLCSYKMLNARYNGAFALTNRASWALYGNIKRRSQPMDRNRLITAFAFIPGEKFCINQCGEKRCDFWSYLQSDGYAFEILYPLKDIKVPRRQIDQLFTSSALACFAAKPLQNIFFMGIESLKFIFWESTRVGYVEYPPWLAALFDDTWLNNLLKLLTAGLTFGGICLAGNYLRRRMKILEFPDNGSQESIVILFFVMTMLSVYILTFSLFYYLIRYAFPIVSLFLICIAYAVQNSLTSISAPKLSAKTPARRGK